MLKEKLEIVLVTYNRKKNLEKTLNQIFATSSPIKDLDITILNNNSNDGTDEVIDSFAAKFSNLKHIKNNKNISGGANVARIYEIANKEYIWGLCDNDIFDFTNWQYIEEALFKGYDVVFTQKTENDLAEIFNNATFVPACIYKTENITNTVLFNVYDNVRNIFPHLAIIAKIINDNKSIYLPDFNIVNTSVNGEFSTAAYLRGLNIEEVPEQRKYLFWSVGYFNSIELIKDKTKRNKIIQGLKRNGSSLEYLYSMAFVNKIYFDNYYFNLYQILRKMPLGRKILFLFAILLVNLKYILIRKKFVVDTGYTKWKNYFEYVDEQKHLDKLAKKYKNKKVLLYGAGIVTDVLLDNYDLSNFNIIGICDKKFLDGDSYRGYNTISPENIKNTDVDIIFFSLYYYKKVYKSLGVKNKYITIFPKNPFVFI